MIAGAIIIVLLLPACQQEMAREPSYRPLESSSFFVDGRSARPLVAGTVSRGSPLGGAAIVSGRKEGSLKPVAAALPSASAVPAPTSGNPLRVEDFVTTFPFPVTEEALKRGQERYIIFCAVCHGPVGNGNGMIVERGYLKPPSYHTDDSRGFARYGLKVPLRDAPVGYYFEVVSEGYGGMPDYATQVSPEDRWKIIAYIRALEWSQSARLEDLPENERKAALKALEK
jgi:mono/diheme cytochrome c family protein